VLTAKSNNRPDRRYCLLRYGTRISVSSEFFLRVSVYQLLMDKEITFNQELPQTKTTRGSQVD